MAKQSKSPTFKIKPAGFRDRNPMKDTAKSGQKAPTSGAPLRQHFKLAGGSA